MPIGPSDFFFLLIRGLWLLFSLITSAVINLSIQYPILILLFIGLLVLLFFKLRAYEKKEGLKKMPSYKLTTEDLRRYWRYIKLIQGERISPLTNYIREPMGTLDGNDMLFLAQNGEVLRVKVGKDNDYWQYDKIIDDWILIGKVGFPARDRFKKSPN